MKNKSLILIIAVAVIVVSIPLTVFVAQKQQEIRQRAQSFPEAGQPSLYFAERDAVKKIDRLRLKPKEQATVSLRLNTAQKDINGFRIVIGAQNYLPIIGIGPGKDADQFDVEIARSIDGSANRLVFFKVSKDTTKAINQDLHLLNIAVEAGDKTENGTIQIFEAQLTSPGQKDGFVALSFPPNDLPFDILGPTSAPVPTSPPPVPTAIPTPTPTPPPPGSTVLALSLTLEGIGANRRDDLPLLPVTVEVFKISGSTKTLASTREGNVEYESKNGKFEGTVDIGNKLLPGKYVAKIKIDKYFKRQSKIFTVEGGQATQTIPVLTTLLAGNIIKSEPPKPETVDMKDYNAVFNCFGAKGNTTSCTDKKSADLNFDGLIDGIDHNITIRNFGKSDE